MEYIVYHSSQSSFDAFAKKSVEGMLGKGFYFTNNVEYSKQFGNNLYKCEIVLNNPIDLTGHNYDAIRKILYKLGNNAFADLINNGNFVSALRKISEKNNWKDFSNLGYDGVISYCEKGGKEYLIYNKSKIKILNKTGLKESRKVGSLYHFTSFGSLSKILDENFLRSSDEYNFGKNENFNGISTTRNKNFNIDNRFGKSLSCRIELDGNVISEKFKILPYNYWNHVPNNNVARSKKNESEEIIVISRKYLGEKGIPNIKKYIKSIVLFPQFESNYEYVKSMLPILIKSIQEKNIKLNLIPKEWEEKYLTTTTQSEKIMESKKFINKIIIENNLKEAIKDTSKFGIEVLKVKKGQPSNIVLNKRYKISEESDLDYKHTFTNDFIGIDKVDQSKPFAVAYFGDNNGNRYEYATAANNINDIISVLNKYDCQEAPIEVYNPLTSEVSIFILYPEANTYTDESVGLSNDIIQEEITLDIDKGDTIKMGKFLNKRVVVKKIGKDDHGMPTVNGKSITRVRIPKIDPTEKKANENFVRQNKTRNITEKLELKSWDEYLKLVAKSYSEAKDYDSSVVHHWTALNASNYILFKRLLSKVEVVFCTSNKSEVGILTIAGKKFKRIYMAGDPYETAAEMASATKSTGRLFISSDYSVHPVFSVVDNIVFRTVHDYIVHILGGHPFGGKGEVAAYNLHAKLVPKDAIPAIFTEVVGQGSVAITTGSFPSKQKIAVLNGFDFINVGKVDGHEIKDKELVNQPEKIESENMVESKFINKILEEAFKYYPVISSNVKIIAYDPDTEELQVEFKNPKSKKRGAIYQYEEVPSKVFAAFKKSASKGKFLYKFIKDQYEYTRIS